MTPFSQFALLDAVVAGCKWRTCPASNSGTQPSHSKLYTNREKNRLVPVTPAVRISNIFSHYPLPTTHYPLPTTHYPLPTTHYHYPLPTTHYHYPLPTTHYPLPTTTTHYPLPTTHYPLPTTHYPLPTTHYPLPTTHYPLPTTSFSAVDLRGFGVNYKRQIN